MEHIPDAVINQYDEETQKVLRNIRQEMIYCATVDNTPETADQYKKYLSATFTEFDRNMAKFDPRTMCAWCSKTSSSVCTRCKESKYCSKDCQKKHWKAGHKSVCK